MGMNDKEMIGNWIEEEGARAMSEMLKVNTTLTSLNLKGQENDELGGGKENNYYTQAILLKSKEQKQ